MLHLWWDSAPDQLIKIEVPVHLLTTWPHLWFCYNWETVNRTDIALRVIQLTVKQTSLGHQLGHSLVSTGSNRNSGSCRDTLKLDTCTQHLLEPKLILNLTLSITVREFQSPAQAGMLHHQCLFTDTNCKPKFKMTVNKLCVMAYARAFLLGSYHPLQKCKFLIMLQKVHF